MLTHPYHRPPDMPIALSTVAESAHAGYAFRQRRGGSPRRDLRRLGRWAVLLLAPVLYVVVGLLHPLENPGVGDDTALFIALHVAQLPLIAGLAAGLWMMLDGAVGRAAAIGRALVPLFLVAYTAMDSILGLAWGYVAAQAGTLGVADQPAVERLMESLVGGPTSVGYAIYFGAGILWLATVISVAIVRWSSAPSGAIWLMVLGAGSFAAGHVKPTGPVGMLSFAVGVWWLERARLAADVRDS